MQRDCFDNEANTYRVLMVERSTIFTKSIRISQKKGETSLKAKLI